MKRRIHLLANAHLDPVWQWDWREGAMEAVSTCRSVAQLMLEFPELTFMRGDAWVYEQVEKYDPELFETIRQLVAQGTWEPVGGGYVQCDTNLPGTATMLRQFRLNKAYFKEKFSMEVETAWYADSFGQSAGMPECYRDCGIRFLCFCRPPQRLFPTPGPVFRWRGAGDSELLVLRTPLDCYYGGREGVGKLLEMTLDAMATHDLENLPCLYGLGDHGGGPSRRNVREILDWASTHRDCEVTFSTLRGFFACLEEEIRRRGLELPVVTGELNYVGRGIFSSCARFKAAFRQAETALRRSAIVTGALGAAQPNADDWKQLAFNSFHDILPGTSIERAYEEQLRQLGGIAFRASELEFAALQKLARQIDIPCDEVPDDAPLAVPFIVFNPRPVDYHGVLELEFSPDYEPLWSYSGHPETLPVILKDDEGTPLAFQKIAQEERFQTNIPLRQRIVFHADIPALGWRRYTVGYLEGAPEPPVFRPKKDTAFHIETDESTGRMTVFLDGRELFGGGGLRLETSPDPFGPWGSFEEEPTAFRDFTHAELWRPGKPECLEDGPIRQRYRVRFQGTRSRAMVDIIFNRGEDAIETSWRVFWDEQDRRLRLLTTLTGGSLACSVPGGEFTRDAAGDVPVGHYLTYSDDKGENRLGWVTDFLSCFGLYPDGMGATILRGNRFCTSDATGLGLDPTAPPCDSGEYRFRLLFVAPEKARAEASRLELPPQVLLSDRHPGTLPGHGSVFRLPSGDTELLDWESGSDQDILTVIKYPPRLAAKPGEVHGTIQRLKGCFHLSPSSPTSEARETRPSDTTGH